MFRFVRRLLELAGDTRGAVAITVALSLIPLSFAAMGAIDLTSGLQGRAHLQDALDAAALAAARSTATDDAGVTAVGRRVLAVNLGTEVATTSEFHLTPQGAVVADASTEVSTIIWQAVAQAPLTVSAHSEVLRSTNDIELSLVLDITGSMAGQKIIDLKSAATELVNMVVKDQQEPFYSKAAIIPYSAEVNPGAYLDSVRAEVPCKKGSEGYGCSTYAFTSATPTSEAAAPPYSLSKCVTERVLSDYRDTDLAPTKDLKKSGVGLHYSKGGSCSDPPIIPLTDDRKALVDSIASFNAGGSTAGQIGLAWGWYAISPSWSGIFTGKSAPAAYRRKNLVKAVVLMTDGEFNSAYCNGVMSTNFHNGGSATVCAASNGSPFDQAARLCAAMKADDIIIYTVGFNLREAAAIAIMNQCATDSDHVYLPNGGVALKDAFRAIGQDINELRITK